MKKLLPSAVFKESRHQFINSWTLDPFKSGLVKNLRMQKKYKSKTWLMKISYKVLRLHTKAWRYKKQLKTSQWKHFYSISVNLFIVSPRGDMKI